MLRLTAVTFLLMASVGCGGDGMTGTIGLFRVVDAASGEPIAGAELIPVSDGKPLAPAARTDAAGNGEYNFEWTTPVPEEQITFQVKAPGYETREVDEDYLTTSATAVVDGAPAAHLELSKSP